MSPQILISGTVRNKEYDTMSSIADKLIKHGQIDVFTHNFCITRASPRMKELVNTFVRRFIGYTWEQTGGIYNKVPNKVFASAAANRTEFRFHIHALEEFKEFLLRFYFTDKLVDWIIHPEPEAVKVDIKVKDGWAARENQLAIIDHLANSPCRIRLAELATGVGKSISAMLAMKQIGLRICVVVAAKYLQKWVDDLTKTYDCDPEEIILVQGGKSLKALLEISQETDFTATAIIISSTTWRNWMTDYEDCGKETLELGYATTPDKFFEWIGCGVRLIDECHQDFHFYFKLDCFTNVRYSISLSATMISSDPFIKKMHNVMFPLDTRLAKDAIPKFIDAWAVHYAFGDVNKIKVNHRGRSDYSHTALEESILMNVPMMLNYLRLLDSVLQFGYFKDKKPGDRAIIFASTVEMCTRMTTWLQVKYPDLDIRRYVGEDPYENVLDADIRVTTIGSGGTAIDIANLACSIMTTAISSVASNVQALGRLRDRKGAGHCRFLYYVATNVDQQVKYHHTKKEMLKERTAHYNDLHSGHVI